MVQILILNFDVTFAILTLAACGKCIFFSHQIFFLMLSVDSMVSSSRRLCQSITAVGSTIGPSRTGASSAFSVPGAQAVHWASEVRPTWSDHLPAEHMPH